MPLHTLQSTPHPALSCQAAWSSPVTKELRLAPTHWQKPLHSEPQQDNIAAPPLPAPQESRSPKVTPAKTGKMQKVCRTSTGENISICPSCSKACPTLVQHVGLNRAGDAGSCSRWDRMLSAILLLHLPGESFPFPKPTVLSLCLTVAGRGCRVSWGRWEAAAMGSRAGSTSAESYLGPALLAWPES